MAKQIPLRARNGTVRGYAVVDDDDFAAVDAWTWRLMKVGYAARGSGRNMVLMHRVLLGLKRGDGLEGDHINGDRLDNRRANLRAVTVAQNRQNRCLIRGRSRYRGVYFDKARQLWAAETTIFYKRYHLGRFKTEEEAGAAAAAFRREHLRHSTL